MTQSTPSDRFTNMKRRKLLFDYLKKHDEYILMFNQKHQARSGELTDRINKSKQEINNLQPNK